MTEQLDTIGRQQAELSPEDQDAQRISAAMEPCLRGARAQEVFLHRKPSEQDNVSSMPHGPEFIALFQEGRAELIHAAAKAGLAAKKAIDLEKEGHLAQLTPRLRAAYDQAMVEDAVGALCLLSTAIEGRWQDPKMVDLGLSVELWNMQQVALNSTSAPTS